MRIPGLPGIFFCGFGSPKARILLSRKIIGTAHEQTEGFSDQALA